MNDNYLRWIENIKIIHYDERLLDKDILLEIEFHEKEALRLREKLGMYISVFVPENHPMIFQKLAKVGKRFEWNEKVDGKDWRETFVIKSVERNGAMTYVLTKTELDEIGFSPDKIYYEISCLYERTEPIVRTTGFARENIFKAKHIIEKYKK